LTSAEGAIETSD